MKNKIVKSIIATLCTVSIVLVLSGCVAYGPVYYHHGYWHPGGGVYVY
jgi:hypothetical protein